MPLFKQSSAVPMIVGALGVVPKALELNMNEMNIRESI